MDDVIFRVDSLDDVRLMPNETIELFVLVVVLG